MENKELKNVTEKELERRMKLLGVEANVTKEELRKAFQTKIKLHHTDKGGDAEMAKEVTLAYRLLQMCLESKRKLPGSPPPKPPTQSRTQPIQRKRNRRAYPYYTVEDHYNNSFTFCFDGGEEKFFGNLDTEFDRFFDGFVEEVIPMVTRSALYRHGGIFPQRSNGFF